MTTREQFVAGLAEHPDDWDRYLVFADWEEERGNLDAARTLRWMTLHRKRPMRGEGSPVLWMWGPAYEVPEFPDCCRLPGVLYRTFNKQPLAAYTGNWLDWDQAFEWLTVCLKKLGWPDLRVLPAGTPVWTGESAWRVANAEEVRLSQYFLAHDWDPGAYPVQAPVITFDPTRRRPVWGAADISRGTGPEFTVRYHR